MQQHTTGIENDLYPDKDIKKKSVPKIPLEAFTGGIQEPVLRPAASAISLEELQAKYRIDLSVALKPQPIALEIVGKEYSAPIATYGGLTLVTAKAKAGKTFAHSILVSALIKGGELFGKIKPHFHPKGFEKNKVIVFDTEMSDYHVQKVGRRISHLADVSNPKNLEVWKLRTEPNDRKKQIIEHVIYNDPTICAIVIDGGRDTIYDINNPEEAVRATSELIKWAEELSIAIIVILHQNKGDNNARGHYGTELKNKAEIIVNVNKDKETDTYSIEPEDCRDREFEPLAFKIDENGMPYLIDEYIPPAAEENGRRRKSALDPHQIPDHTHQEILKEVFTKEPRPQFKDMATQISLCFQAYGVKLSQTKMNDYWKYYCNKRWVVVNEKLAKERYTTYRFYQPL